MQYFTVFVSLNFNLLIFWSSLEFQIKRNFWDQELFNTNLKILFYFIFPIFILNIIFFFKQVNTFQIHINVLFNDIYHNLNFKKKDANTCIQCSSKYVQIVVLRSIKASNLDTKLYFICMYLLLNIREIIYNTSRQRIWFTS